MLYKMRYRMKGTVHEDLMDIDTKIIKEAYDYCEKWCQERSATIAKFVGVNYAVLNQIPVEPKLEAKPSATKAA